MEKKKDERWEVLGASVHPLSHRLEFRGGRIKDVVPALRSTDWKCPMVVWEVESEGCDGIARETTGREIV